MAQTPNIPNIGLSKPSAVDSTDLPQYSASTLPSASQKVGPDTHVKGNPKDSKYDVSNFHYPADLLGADNHYGNTYVMFYINIHQDNKIVNKFNDSGKTMENVDKNDSGLRADLQTKEVSAAKRGLIASQGVGKQAAAVGGGAAVGGKLFGPAGAVIGGVTAYATVNRAAIGATTAIGSKSRATKRLKAAVALYVPNDLSVKYSVDWSAHDTVHDQMKMLGIDSITGLMTEGSADTEAIKSALGNVALTNGPGAKLLSGVSGLAGNSKKEMLFNTVDYRTFTFTYDFAPRNADELKLVENIVGMFKYHMHPEYLDDSNFLFVYPSEFDIVYYVDGNPNNHLHRHTSCVLADLSVLYTPSGAFSSFKGNDSKGAPTHVKLTLTFKELALLTKKDIENGY